MAQEPPAVSDELGYGKAEDLPGRKITYIAGNPLQNNIFTLKSEVGQIPCPETSPISSRYSPTTWDRKGIADDTLLIFTSDNGPECIPAAAGGSYEHIRDFGHYSMAHLRGVKRDTWEGGHRVPFVARWPGVTPAGAVCEQLTILGDLLATCAQLMGRTLRKSEGEDSVSMLPLLHGHIDTPIRDFAVHHSASGRFAIRKNNWVFIDAPSGDDNHEPDWFKEERGYTAHNYSGELFNLQDDIAERKNLFNEHPEIVRSLSQRLADIKHPGDPIDYVMGSSPQSE